MKEKYLTVLALVFITCLAACLCTFMVCDCLSYIYEVIEQASH